MALSMVCAVLGVFRIFVKNLYLILLCRKNGPERIFGSSQTYLFNSNYNIDPSTMVIRHIKICVSFADKYIFSKYQSNARGVAILSEKK